MQKLGGACTVKTMDRHKGKLVSLHEQKENPQEDSEQG